MGERTPEIHPTAIVHPGAQIGAGVRIGPYASARLLPSGHAYIRFNSFSGSLLARVIVAPFGADGYGRTVPTSR